MQPPFHLEYSYGHLGARGHIPTPRDSQTTTPRRMTIAALISVRAYDTGGSSPSSISAGRWYR